jgi:tetratricopeptide (TPR) repeat protein
VSDLIALRPGPRKGCRRATTATALYALGCALEATDPAAAMAAYRKAALARPWLGDAHCNLGRLQHEAGDAAAAEASYRRALAADPSIALYHYNLGVALEDLGRAADAVAAYQAALEREPTLAEASHNLARLGR